MSVAGAGGAEGRAAACRGGSATGLAAGASLTFDDAELSSAGTVSSALAVCVRLTAPAVAQAARRAEGLAFSAYRGTAEGRPLAQDLARARPLPLQQLQRTILWSPGDAGAPALAAVLRLPARPVSRFAAHSSAREVLPTARGVLPVRGASTDGYLRDRPGSTSARLAVPVRLVWRGNLQRPRYVSIAAPTLRSKQKRT